MVRIRKAKARDLDAMIPLWHQMHTFHIPFSKPYYRLRSRKKAFAAARKHLETSIQEEGALVYVAVKDGKIVGYLKAEITHRAPVFPESQRVVLLDTVVVEESHRQMGIFTKLQRRLEADAVRLGAMHIQLSVDVLNFAKDIYQRAGYEIRQLHLVKPLSQRHRRGRTHG